MKTAKEVLAQALEEKEWIAAWPEMADAILAALREAGYCVTMAEPTDEMVLAAQGVYEPDEEYGISDGDMRDAIRAAIKAGAG